MLSFMRKKSFLLYFSFILLAHSTPQTIRATQDPAKLATGILMTTLGSCFSAVTVYFIARYIREKRKSKDAMHLLETSEFDCKEFSRLGAVLNGIAAGTTLLVGPYLIATANQP